MLKQCKRCFTMKNIRGKKELCKRCEKEFDNQITLDCAFRYALGRMTYVTEAVSNVIIERWDALPFSKKEMIVAEIKKAVAEDRIGMECDRIAWQRICLLHEATKEKSKETGGKDE